MKYCTQCGSEAEEKEFPIPESFDMDTGKQNTKLRLICSRNECHMDHHRWRIVGFWESWRRGADEVCDRCGEKNWYDYF